MEMFEALIDEENFINGIHAVSLVESPAIESEFIKLSKQEVTFKTVDEDKRLLLGAVLVPNKPIYRIDEDSGDEFHMFFSKDTVRRASELFFIKGFQSNTTLEHQVPLEGLTMVESWIVEDIEMDKSKFHNLSVPVGTWMGTVRVEDEKVWKEVVKGGSVKGFSIEGFFVPTKTDMKKTLTDEQIVNKIRKMLDV